MPHVEPNLPIEVNLTSNTGGNTAAKVRRNAFRNKLSNFIASVMCYVFMPLTPFVFEFAYSRSHEISMRSVVIALSTYAFSGAFGTKSRTKAIVLIFGGFLAGGLYGAVDIGEKAKLLSFPSMSLYLLVILYLWEYSWRHFKYGEQCWFYTIFENSKKEIK